MVVDPALAKAWSYQSPKVNLSFIFCNSEKGQNCCFCYYFCYYHLRTTSQRSGIAWYCTCVLEKDGLALRELKNVSQEAMVSMDS